MHSINHEIFAQNLLLTQAYCEMQLANSNKHVSEILRSINPEYDGKPMFHFLDGPYTYLEYYTDPLSPGLYEKFFDCQLKYKRNSLPGVQKTTSVKGQILMVDIYEALPDGASEAETEGFIDGNDCPPIDTWFYIGQGDKWPILFAWIPEPFVERVDQGIAVNALEIFDWMENPQGTLNTGRFDQLLEKPQPGEHSSKNPEKSQVTLKRKFPLVDFEKFDYPWAMVLRLAILFALMVLLAYFGMK